MSIVENCKARNFLGYAPLFVLKNKLLLIFFLLNNQAEALIIQIYSVKELYMFRVSSLPSSGVLYCTFSTGKFHAGF